MERFEVVYGSARTKKSFESRTAAEAFVETLPPGEYAGVFSSPSASAPSSSREVTTTHSAAVHWTTKAGELKHQLFFTEAGAKAFARSMNDAGEVAVRATWYPTSSRAHRRLVEAAEYKSAAAPTRSLADCRTLEEFCDVIMAQQAGAK